MMHETREYSVVAVATPEELAKKLTEYTWCGCNGFLLDWRGRTLLYLNDSTGPDGAQEYAVIQAIGGGAFEQVESITFGWMDEKEAISAIRDMHVGSLEKYGRVNVTVKTPEDHGRCRYCA